MKSLNEHGASFCFFTLCFLMENDATIKFIKWKKLIKCLPKTWTCSSGSGVSEFKQVYTQRGHNTAHFPFPRDKFNSQKRSLRRMTDTEERQTELNQKIPSPSKLASAFSRCQSLWQPCGIKFGSMSVSFSDARLPPSLRSKTIVSLAGDRHFRAAPRGAPPAGKDRSARRAPCCLHLVVCVYDKHRPSSILLHPDTFWMQVAKEDNVSFQNRATDFKSRQCECEGLEIVTN